MGRMYSCSWPERVSPATRAPRHAAHTAMCASAPPLHAADDAAPSRWQAPRPRSTAAMTGRGRTRTTRWTRATSRSSAPCKPTAPLCP
eukprot:scaffold5067_cov65-Phaeocystis_antarctica.AAC.4